MIATMYANENYRFFIDIFFNVSYVHHHTLKSMCTKFHDDWLNILLLHLYFSPRPILYMYVLSCRPFVVITTLSIGLVGVEVTSVFWLGQLQKQDV